MLSVTNLTDYKIDKKRLEKTARKTFKIANIGKLKEISVVFVSSNKIKEINKKYRRKNRPTDVLSFGELNEVFVCPQIVKKQAKLLKIPFNSELTRVVIHGILHLAGCDHEKNADAMKMQIIQERIVKLIF